MSEEVLLASGREQAGLYSGADGAMQEKEVSQVMTPPELADRYRFIKALGEGAQGKVFLAQRLLDGKQVAIKQLRIDSIKTWKEYTLFHREAEVPDFSSPVRATMTRRLSGISHCGIKS